MSLSRGIRRLAAVLVAVVASALIGLAWYFIGPGPMGFAGGGTVALADYAGANPTGVPAVIHQADLVTRGKYLADAADCKSCHTAEGGTLFAGGRAFKTPFGTLYAPNITPDKETGIGDWSDQDFLSAVHQGIARNGSRLYPAFPYAAYTYLTNDDVLAIKAYLFSLAPVHNAPPPNSFAFPYDQRWLMAIWSWLYNPDQRFRPNAARSPEWNRGAYLVEALGHCGDCHTPRNPMQALDNRIKFAGSDVSGWRAYNITGDRDSGIGSWSDEELAQYLSIGHATGHGTASGPMGEAVDLSLVNLTGSDIAAIVTYLRSVPTVVTTDLPAPKAASATAEPGAAPSTDPRGQRIFAGACAGCHGWTGVSPVNLYATLAGARAVNDPSALNIAQIVLWGERRQAIGRQGFMPAFGEAYSDVEIAAVANYVTARFGAELSSISPDAVAAIRSKGSP